MESYETLLTVGNSAKLYCLNWIEQHLLERSTAVTILDLGCGTANNFVKLLQRYPQINYVGIEPSPTAYRQAQKNVQGLNAQIINDYAYGVYSKVQRKFDYVVSFSALEHVYRRASYLRSAKECLAHDGHFLINYDAGHFITSGWRDRVKNIIGPVLARLGFEQYYQSFVREDAFRRLVHSLSLRIDDEKSFNTHLKGLYKSVPPANREAYMQKWLQFELWVNEQVIPYTDAQAINFYTRNFILKHNDA